jgi:Tol biopolymer transport system component/serine/threonine protein kinase
MSERSDRLDELFHQALTRTKDKRIAFLAEACGGDEALHRELQSMLSALERAGEFMEVPALELAARMARQSGSQLPAGYQLGTYRVEALLGRGGMGEVYRAVDMRLDRPVALKLLPAEVAGNPERLRRFTREAKAASILNHPNLATVYEIGEAEGWHFIAMEHVEGETLEARLRGRRAARAPAEDSSGRKPSQGGTGPGGDVAGTLGFQEILDIGIQIADALEAAHAKGIIHRDIKPGNLMLTPQGQVKVLDFGLAKRLHPTTPTDGMVSTTTPGVIMGTVEYMSPEQVSGQEVDQRTDLFSLGVALYDMTAGRLPFSGNTPTDTMHNILHAEPEALTRFNQKAPAQLERIIGKCLEKRRELRYQSANEVRVALERLKRDLESGREAAARGAVKHLQHAKVAGFVVVVVALSLFSWYWLSRQRSARPGESLIPIPLTAYPGWEDAPSFSPDGTQVAFRWCRGGLHKDCDIYIKQIGVEPPVRLTSDPADDFSPAWSPDGNFIAFLRVLFPNRSSLLVIPQRGGQERVLGELGFDYTMGTSLAWTPDSKWLAYPAPESSREPPPLILLNVATGERRRLIESGGYCPAFSADGRNLAFSQRETDICLLRLAEGYVPQGTPERLLSVSDLWPGIEWMPDGSEIVFTRGLFLNGNLWRVTALASARPRRVTLASEGSIFPTVSRHGNRLAFTVRKFDTNIWRVDLGKQNPEPGARERLIYSTRQELWPRYSPDGRRIAFLSDRSGANEAWVCNSDGSNAVQLTSCGNVANGPRWSPDGQKIGLAIADARYQHIYVISANGGFPRRLTRETAVVDKWPCWSRDGQWIYFSSHRSGMCEIWKMSATGENPIQITPDGEERDVPQESPDGKFLYYWKPSVSSVWSVWRMPVGGGEEAKVLDSVNPVGAFIVRGQGIYFFAPADVGSPSDICLYDFATGKARKILTIEQGISAYIDVSDDGRMILYPQIDEAGSDLMLVENFR